MKENHTMSIFIKENLRKFDSRMSVFRATADGKRAFVYRLKYNSV